MRRNRKGLKDGKGRKVGRRNKENGKGKIELGKGEKTKGGITLSTPPPLLVDMCVRMKMWVTVEGAI